MRQLKPNVFEVGAIDWDRRLFDELVPLPNGTSYNSYLVKGSEKTALLDTVDPTKIDILLENLAEAKPDNIDYVISHHAEQDHSGCIPDILTMYPEAKVVTNPKCKKMLIDLLHIDEDRFITVADGETLSLGDKTLRFIYIPWVHWPETLGAYLEEDEIFFSCDFFGSHLATSSLFVDDESIVYSEAKRYYAEIMMPLRITIKKNLEKMQDLQIDMIAPSHGPVYQKPGFIIDAYKDWVSDDVKNKVVLMYVSMHDSTKKMTDHLVRALMERNIVVKQFNMAVADTGMVAMALVDAATIVLGSPTVLSVVHPKVAYGAILANMLRPKSKYAAIYGSYGWGGKMVEQMKQLISNLRVELLEPVEVRGNPREEDFKSLDKLADDILAKHKELGIVN
ncbi:MAG: FprA family A-type flavoprotein [Planctomycetota bacterium]|jgi:flavorubredoxin